MFYYLIYNSSISFVVENRLFSTILYGSILYILTHAILNYCDISILNIINNYYWTLFTLDIISFAYSLYQSLTVTDSQGDLNVSFNLLKNKINTIINKKSDLTITQSTVQNKQNTNPTPNLKQQSSTNNTNNNTQSQTYSNKFSTPISQLQQNKKQNTNQNTNQKSSTPISLIRNNVKIVEPYVDDLDSLDNLDGLDNQDSQENQDNLYTESNTGSDLGSVMDLADFETSL